MIKAVLFDLDGVITNTSLFHYQAWKALANQLGGDITEEFNEDLKGVDRFESLSRVLKEINVTLTEEEKNEAMKWKNELYVKLLKDISSENILPGIVEFMDELKAAGIKISIASASKNAPLILDKLELGDYIDAVANPGDVENNKPAPDIFLLAAKIVDVPINECVGIEDAQAGIDALNSANIKSIAIGTSLEGYTLLLSNTKELSLKILNTL